MRQFLYLCSVVLLLASCTDFSSEKKEVEQLSESVIAQQERLKSLHPDSLPMNKAVISSKIRQITDNYNAREEILNKDLSIMLADFKVFTKVFKGLPQKRMRLKQELEITSGQLQDLSRDLKEGAINKEQATKYIADEKKALSALTASMDKLDTLMSRGSRGYIRMLPKVDSVIGQLEQVPSE